MAPQQRIALELAWTAIEDAGYKAGFFKASKTGVFLGVCDTDSSPGSTTHSRLEFGYTD